MVGIAALERTSHYAVFYHALLTIVSCDTGYTAIGAVAINVAYNIHITHAVAYLAALQIRHNACTKLGHTFHMTGHAQILDDTALAQFSEEGCHLPTIRIIDIHCNSMTVAIECAAISVKANVLEMLAYVITWESVPRIVNVGCQLRADV